MGNRIFVVGTQASTNANVARPFGVPSAPESRKQDQNSDTGARAIVEESREHLYETRVCEQVHAYSFVIFFNCPEYRKS